MQEDDLYQYEQVGHESSQQLQLPEKIQLKGWFLDADEDEFDLAWYVKEDVENRERNLILQAIAVVLQDSFNVGWKDDEHDLGNKILIIDLPQGQVSYDIPKSSAFANLSDFQGVLFRRVGWEQCDHLQNFIQGYNRLKKSREI